MAITNEKELNEALQNGVDSIEIEGNLRELCEICDIF